MGKEIERKYLIDLKKWQKLEKPPGRYYRQGYLLTDPQKTIRVRFTGSKGFLTIKGISVGSTRLEYEYEIPVIEAKELLDNFSVSELCNKNSSVSSILCNSHPADISHS
jgi:adenylate cyclase